MVPLPGNPLKNLNAYLIKGKDRNLLIDTGFNRPECRAALLSGLDELGVSMDGTDIFLTHLHSDHTGLAPSVAGPDTRIFISRTDGERLIATSHTGGWSRLDAVHRREGFPEAEILDSHTSPMRMYCSEPFEDYTFVAEGDTLEYGGRRLLAAATPGHTPGHMCLYDAEGGCFFLGDHVLFDITPNITVWPDFPDPLGTYARSLMKIRDWPVRFPLPAHRSPNGSLPERVDTILEHHGVRLREMLDALQKSPGITAYDLSGKMTWRVRGSTPAWRDFPLSQKWFAVGETHAHLDYLVLRARVRRDDAGPADLYYPA